MAVQSGAAGVDTYFLTDAEFETVDAYSATTDTIGGTSTVPVAADQYEGITTFTISDFTSGYHAFTGTKAQPWPDAAWSSMYRFEREHKAMGLIFYFTDATVPKWIDEEKTL